MTPHILPSGHIVGAHIEKLVIKVGPHQVTAQAHLMVWWLTGGVAKGLTGQFSLH